MINTFHDKDSKIKFFFKLPDKKLFENAKFKIFTALVLSLIDL